MNWISLKTALRSFRRKPLLPSLNLFGLSLGIGCFLTISLYIYQENTYDSGFSDYEHIYRVEEHFLSMGQLAWTSSNVAYELDEAPIVQAHTRVNSYEGQTKINVGDRSFKLDHVLSGDSAFFQVFDFKFLHGNPNDALSGPKQAVISYKTALKLFGKTDVLGETIASENRGDYIISGVLAPQELKSHLDFDVLVYRKRARYNANTWFGIGGYSYAKLTKGTTQASFDRLLTDISEEKVYPVIYPKGQTDEDALSFEEWAQSPNRVTLYAKPLRDIYLNSHLQFEIGPNGDKQTRVTLSIIGVFILLIAVINFMNLSTSRAANRAKEVGVKKVLGAGRERLIKQFLFQSVLFTIMAALIGGGISELFVRLINEYLGETITVALMSQPNLVLGTVIGLIVLGLVAGSYPAFYLSSVKSVPLMKGKSLSQAINMKSALGLRNGLVVFQFVISSALIAASVVVFQQMQHLKQMDLGFAKERVAIIEDLENLNNGKEAFKNALLANSQVNQVSFTQRVPNDGSNSTLSTMLDSETTMTFGQFFADANLAETLGLELLGGEWFKMNEPKYDSVVIINESAARAMDIENPVGEVFGNYYRIKAVVKDFKFANVRDEIGPAVIFNSDKSFSRIAVNLNSEEMGLEELNDIWTQHSDAPMEAYFLDDKYEQLLKKEKQATDGVLAFTALAIIIAALGLFGLATFSAEQRKHEFGIRRVLGANLNQILGLFSMHFLRLILLAFILSVPLAYYGLNQWLNGFANRIELSASVFVVSGVLALIVAGLTLAFQSLRISQVNPVETLEDQ